MNLINSDHNDKAYYVIILHCRCIMKLQNIGLTDFEWWQNTTTKEFADGSCNWNVETHRIYKRNAVDESCEIATYGEISPNNVPKLNTDGLVNGEMTIVKKLK